MEVKIFDLFLYTIYKGWMYMIDTDKLKPGDILTDGENQYKIRDDSDGTKYRYPVPFGEDCWIYGFDEKIPDCEGKILNLAPSLTRV